MSTVAEITEAIAALPTEDFRVLLAAVHEEEARRFDAALEADAASGKLDAVLARVRADIKAGRVKPLDEILDDA